MKICCLLILTVQAIIFCSCSNLLLSKNIEDSEFLEDCFINQDTLKISLMFNNWFEKSKPNNNLKENLESEVYLIYQQIYPKLINPLRLSNGELLYKPKYHLIQNSIEIEITDSIFVLHKEELKDFIAKFCEPGIIKTINDFRPFVKLENRIIYCDSIMENSLLSFLTKYDNNRSESEARMKFLEKYIKVYGHHWGGSPHIFSQPIILRIILDEDFTKCIITYRNGYSFVSKSYEKEKGNWNFVSLLRLMVE